MKVSRYFIVFFSTILICGFYSYFHHLFLLKINPDFFRSFVYKQFSPDGTLVYEDFSQEILLISFLKSLIISLPLSIIWLIQIKPNQKLFTTLFKLNLIVPLVSILFSLTAIPISNFYFRNHSELKNSTEYLYPIILADNFHLFAIIGFIIGVFLTQLRKLSFIL